MSLTLSRSPLALLSSLFSPLGAENAAAGKECFPSMSALCKMTMFALYVSMAVSGVFVLYWLVLR
jgi:hypothetical protein